MHTSRTARCYDYGLCLCNHKLFCFHIHQNRSCGFAVFIQNKFDCRCKVDNGNTAVQYLVTQSSHNFRTRIILCRVHSLARCAAAVRGNHRSVLCFIKLNAQIIEPLNCLGGIAYQFCQQLFLCREMSAAESVNKVDCRRIVFFIRRLDSALCHHCVCITDTQLCDNHCFRTGIIRLDCRRRTCAAAADNKYVNIIINL